jgi:hypothetical protein
MKGRKAGYRRQRIQIELFTQVLIDVQQHLVDPFPVIMLYVILWHSEAGLIQK